MLSIIYHLELVVIKINMDKANTLLAKKEYYESLTSIMPLDSMIPSLRGSSASSSSSRRLNVDDEDEDEEEEIELVYDEETGEWIEVEYEGENLYEDEDDDAVDIDHPSFVDVKKQATYRMLWMKDGWREPTIAHYIPPNDEDERVDVEESTMTTKKGKKKNREEKNKNKKKEKEKSQEVVKDDNQDKKFMPKKATKKKEKKDKADSDTPTPTRTKKKVQQRSSQKTQGEIDREKRIKEKAKGTLIILLAYIVLSHVYYKFPNTHLFSLSLFRALLFEHLNIYIHHSQGRTNEGRCHSKRRDTETATRV